MGQHRFAWSAFAVIFRARDDGPAKLRALLTRLCHENDAKTLAASWSHVVSLTHGEREKAKERKRRLRKLKHFANVVGMTKTVHLSKRERERERERVGERGREERRGPM